MGKNDIDRIDKDVTVLRDKVSSLEIALTETNGSLKELIRRIDDLLNLSQKYVTESALEDKLKNVHERFEPVRIALLWAVRFGAAMIFAAVGVLILK